MPERRTMTPSRLLSDQTGDSYAAKFDGKDYPYKGRSGVTSVSLEKIDANTIVETATYISLRGVAAALVVLFRRPRSLKGEAGRWARRHVIARHPGVTNYRGRRRSEYAESFGRMVSQDGIEPSTRRLRVCCSAN
jgi:hypothetical protein